MVYLWEDNRLVIIAVLSAESATSRLVQFYAFDTII